MTPTIEELIPRALDIYNALGVQVEIDYRRKIVYVHVQGATLLRATFMELELVVHRLDIEAS